MILAFLDDGTLWIHEDLAAVQREYEGVDVEDEAVHFYNEHGVYLEPAFIVPNRRGKMLGFIDVVTSGVFQLVPTERTQPDSFAFALHKTISLGPNRWFDSLEQLKSELSEKGAVVLHSDTQDKNEV